MTAYQAEFQKGQVVWIKTEDGFKRLQIVGRKEGSYRGFVLEEGENPRQHRGYLDIFYSFRREDITAVEDTKWTFLDSAEVAAAAVILGRKEMPD